MRKAMNGPRAKQKAAKAAAAKETIAKMAAKKPVIEEEEDELPFPWMECYDNASGACYYYNTKTEETTWEKPVVQKKAKDKGSVGLSMAFKVKSWQRRVGRTILPRCACACACWRVLSCACVCWRVLA